MTAAKAGRHAKVIKLLKDGADPNTVEFDPVIILKLIYVAVFYEYLLCHSFGGHLLCGQVTEDMSRLWRSF